MPQTLAMFSAPFTGDLKSYAAAGAGASVVTTPAPPSSSKETYVLQLVNSVSPTCESKHFNYAPATSTYITSSVWFRTNAIPTIAAGVFYAFSVELRMTTAGKIELKDIGGTWYTFDAVLSVDTWYQFVVKHQNTASVPVQIWYRTPGTKLKLLGVVASASMSGGTGFDTYIRATNGTNASDSVTYYVGSCAVWYDDGANMGTYTGGFGECYCIGPYNNSSQGITSQIGGDDLDSGKTWAMTDEIPVVIDTTDAAKYTLVSGVTKAGGVTSDAGSHTGPSGDTRVGTNGKVWGAQFYWVFSRTGFVASSLRGKFGKTTVGDETTDHTSFTSSVTLTTSTAWLFAFTNTAAEVAENDEWFQVGYEVQSAGNGNGQMYGCGAFALVEFQGFACIDGVVTH